MAFLLLLFLFMRLRFAKLTLHDRRLLEPCTWVNLLHFSMRAFEINTCEPSERMRTNCFYACRIILYMHRYYVIPFARIWHVLTRGITIYLIKHFSNARALRRKENE